MQKLRKAPSRHYQSRFIHVKSHVAASCPKCWGKIRCRSRGSKSVNRNIFFVHPSVRRCVPKNRYCFRNTYLVVFHKFAILRTMSRLERVGRPGKLGESRGLASDHGMVRRPRQYIEVGVGNVTKPGRKDLQVAFASRDLESFLPLYPAEDPRQLAQAFMHVRSRNLAATTSAERGNRACRRSIFSSFKTSALCLSYLDPNSVLSLGKLSGNRYRLQFIKSNFRKTICFEMVNIIKAMGKRVKRSIRFTFFCTSN